MSPASGERRVCRCCVVSGVVTGFVQLLGFLVGSQSGRSGVPHNRMFASGMRKTHFPQKKRSIRFGSIRFGSVRFDSIRFDSIRFGSIASWNQPTAVVLARGP